MKKLALAAALLGVFGTAQATGLSVANQSGLINPFVNYNGQPATITGAETAGVYGNLVANVAGTITFTYLGQESGNKNRFKLDLGSSNQYFYDNNGSSGQTALGSSITDTTVAPGLVDFKFTDTSPWLFDQSVSNGSNPNKFNGLSFAFLGSVVNGAFVFDTTTTYGSFDYIIGLNDLANDDDYDDLVVGVKFTPSAVPVPAALPLMATALGLFGFGASRRRIK